MKYYIIYLLKGKVQDISSFCFSEYDAFETKLELSIHKLSKGYCNYDEIRTCYN